jgi:hypothetical protein
MATVLVFADHEPSEVELPRLTASLESVVEDGGDITVLVPVRAARTSSLMDEVAAARGMNARSATGDMRTDEGRTETEARARLAHLVAELRQAGYAVHGELVTGPPARAIRRQLDGAGADTVVVLDGHHRLAHLFGADVVRRLRRGGDVQVVPVVGVTDGPGPGG